MQVRTMKKIRRLFIVSLYLYLRGDGTTSPLNKMLGGPQPPYPPASNATGYSLTLTALFLLITEDVLFFDYFPVILTSVLFILLFILS